MGVRVGHFFRQIKKYIEAFETWCYMQKTAENFLDEAKDK